MTMQNYSLLLGKNEHCPLETLNVHVPGFTGGRGGGGQGGGGIILETALSRSVPHIQLEPHHPIQDTHSVRAVTNAYILGGDQTKNSD